MTGFKRRVRNIFITGLLVTLPIAFTIFILNFLFKTLDNWLSPSITKLLILAGAPILEDFRVPGLGVAATVFIIFLVGVLTKNIFGAKLVQLGEMIVEKIPIVRNIYTGAKQVVTTIAHTDTNAFSRVVLVEFPRKGIHAMGFVTSETKGEVQALIEGDVVSVFVPTTPNPTSGFLVFLPQNDIIDLTMSVEDGIKLIISCGIVTPKFDSEKLLDPRKDF
ncbi:MAG: DUF502 domain-containing protein [Nitrospina sp.]|nr:MAG: DUF502 domain-containing protein [Nitrospina sp.]